MKNDTDTNAAQLQDLIQILTDRVKIYTTAISSIDANQDIDLIALLENTMQLSQQFKSELNGVLAKEDTAFSEREWTAGNLYTLWEAEKPSLEGLGREEVIEACKKMENAIQDVFQAILSHKSNYTENTAMMLKSQAALQQEITQQINVAGSENKKGK